MSQTDPTTGATWATQAEIDAFLKEAENAPFDLEIACCDMLESHGDDAEEVARQDAARFRAAGNTKWAVRCEEIARAGRRQRRLRGQPAAGLQAYTRGGSSLRS